MPGDPLNRSSCWPVPLHACTHRRTRFRRHPGREIVIYHRWNGKMNVDPIEQRSRDPRQILLHRSWRTDALPSWIARVRAGTGFRCPNTVAIHCTHPEAALPKAAQALRGPPQGPADQLGLLQREVAARIGVTKEVIHNWERDHAEPELRYYPALIEVIGYNPLPEPRTFGQAVRRERQSRGWSIARLAREAGVDPATVARLERDHRRMARRRVDRIVAALDLPLLPRTESSG